MYLVSVCVHSYQLQLVNSFDYLSALIKASQKCLYVRIANIEREREREHNINLILCALHAKIRINMNKNKCSKYKNEYNQAHLNVKFASALFLNSRCCDVD